MDFGNSLDKLREAIARAEAQPEVNCRSCHRMERPGHVCSPSPVNVDAQRRAIETLEDFFKRR
jgi:hypothetical protein